MQRERSVRNVSKKTLSFAEALELNRPVNGPLGRVSPRVQVVIVGAGPIGLLAANLLGAESVEVLVLEKNTTTSGLPKAIVMDDEHLRALDRLGLAGDVEDGSPPFGIHFIAANGRPIVRASGFITANGRGNRNAISQPVYEKALLKGLEKHSNVSVRFATEATGFQQDDNGVRLSVKSVGGAETSVQADFLLGCDGANSLVRKALKISFAGRRIDQPHLVVDLADFQDDAPYSRFFCDPARPFNSVPGPYGGRRIEFMLIEGDNPAELCSPEAVRRLIDKHTPYAGVPLHILRAAVYGFSERVAEKLSQGRVFLLGDAAHVMPPFGAQGLNTGARDAVNLCWKIHGTLTGRWGRGVLKSYDAERKAQIEQTIAYSVRLGQLANIQSRTLAAVRNFVFRVFNLHSGIRSYFSQMRYMPKPKIGAGLLLSDSRGNESDVGTIFPRIEGLGEGAGRNFDQIAGAGFSLVGIAVDEDKVRRILSWAPWDILRPAIVCLDENAMLSAANAALDSRLRQLLSVHRGEVLIVRPDRYIAGCMRSDDIGAKSHEFSELLRS
jgi:3-(3-hydroxy-phenyl)propionate hydroxylase